MAIIKAPNKQYTGISAGVSFINGVGECDDLERLKWFERSGYNVEEVVEQDKKEPDVPPTAPAKPEGSEPAPDPDSPDGDKPKGTKAGK